MTMTQTKRLSDNYRSLFLGFLLLFSYCASGQTYTPSVCCTVSNKPYGAAQAVSTDGRSWFYDATNFVMRDYNGPTEVYSYLNLAKYRSGHFPIFVHSGGVLQGNGVWLGGSTLVYWFKDSTGNTNLVRWYTDSTGTPGGPFYAVANNLSEGNAGLIKGNLSLDMVNNTSDAQKNAAAVALTNHTINGSLNTLSNIPNSALTNNSIGLTLTATGSDVSIPVTPAALGASLTLNIPSSSGSSRGVLPSADFTAFHNKNDSATISSDSLYNWVNGTRTLQSVISGTGGVNSVDGTNTSLLFSPTTGAVLGQVNPAYAFNWTGQHTFTSFAPIFSTLTTNGGIFYGDGLGQLLQTASGGSAQILQSNGGGAPTFFTPNAATVNGWLGYTALSSALTSTHIFVGNGSNIATGVALSGDATLLNTGALTNVGLKGAVLPALSTGNLRYTGSAWIFDNSSTAQTFPQVLATGRTFTANDSVLLGGKTFRWKAGRTIADSLVVGNNGPMLAPLRTSVPNFAGGQLVRTINTPGSDSSAAGGGYVSPWVESIDGAYTNFDGQRDWVYSFGYNSSGGGRINTNDVACRINMESYYQPAPGTRGDFEVHFPEFQWLDGTSARLASYTIKTATNNKGVQLDQRATAWNWQDLFTAAPVLSFTDAGGFQFTGKPAAAGTIISLADSAATAYWRVNLIPLDELHMQCTLPMSMENVVKFGYAGNQQPMQVQDHNNTNNESVFLWDLASTNNKKAINIQGTVDGVLANQIQNLSTVSGAHNEMYMDASGPNHNQIRFGNITNGKFVYLTVDSSTMVRFLSFDGGVHTNFEIDANHNTSIGNISGTTDNSAYLQIQGTAGGFLPPVLTTTQRNAITSPAAGLHVAQSDTLGALGYYNGTAWQTYADRNWVRAGVASGIKYLHSIFTPTTGGTVSLVNGNYNIINPAGALLALTVNLPSSPANNDVVYIKFTQTVTTVTYGNGTVVDGITGPAAGGLVVLTYDSGTTSWY